MSDNRTSRPSSREALMKMLFQMEIQGDFSEEAKQNFSEEFLGEDLDRQYFDAVFDAYINNNNEIDDLIESFSKGWKLERLAKVDLTVLRICIAETLYLKEDPVPMSAAINEAVRIAKIYGGKDSQKFVNGILGRISKEQANADK
ncbi:MAG: transcription antitermination factor NusB [Firmicutes bacterium]|nr:transcription antitermination factor NusB [Bacillota bacterium]MBQ2311312.1 transcription antitermination factor NusB [Bacillota bacterium]MBR6237407.1 transcription antitermination factor NusB [Bacillota bacterium]